MDQYEFFKLHSYLQTLKDVNISTILAANSCGTTRGKEIGAPQHNVERQIAARNV